VNETVIGDDGWAWNLEKRGEIISCPWHSWKFDIVTGENVDDPQYRVPTYEVDVDKGGDVYVVL